MPKGNTFISKPADKVLMSDLDKTLISVETQRETAPGLRDAVEYLQSSGWTIGLSSDTPLESLHIWAERFSIKGPIIAEKGALVEINGKTSSVNPQNEIFFKSLSARVAERLNRTEMTVKFESPIEVMRNGTQLGSVNEKIVFINALRKCSVGLFVFKVNSDRKLSANLDDIGMIESLVKSELASMAPTPFTISSNMSKEHGVLMFSDARTNKREGSLLLMKSLSLNQIGMIGDSRSDFLGKDIAKHYAVGNATDELKLLADYISPQPVTAGAVDVLGKLERD